MFGRNTIGPSGWRSLKNTGEAAGDPAHGNPSCGQQDAPSGEANAIAQAQEERRLIFQDDFAVARPNGDCREVLRRPLHRDRAPVDGRMPL